ncbi:hypothetical protein GCM10010149_84730 [Nonomuraea roseoviolacea subsp. roseoviolacea]
MVLTAAHVQEHEHPALLHVEPPGASTPISERPLAPKRARAGWKERTLCSTTIPELTFMATSILGGGL